MGATYPTEEQGKDEGIAFLINPSPWAEELFSYIERLAEQYKLAYQNPEIFPGEIHKIMSEINQDSPGWDLLVGIMGKVHRRVSEFSDAMAKAKVMGMDVDRNLFRRENEDTRNH